jgi:hypothetical protein
MWHPGTVVAMVVLKFQLEVTDAGDVFWSAGSPDIPSLRASSPRLLDCQRLAIDVLDAADVDTSNVRYVLANPA